jgi:hypothetical protein
MVVLNLKHYDFSSVRTASKISHNVYLQGIHTLSCREHKMYSEPYHLLKSIY